MPPYPWTKKNVLPANILCVLIQTNVKQAEAELGQAQFTGRVEFIDELRLTDLGFQNSRIKIGTVLEKLYPFPSKF